MRQGSARASGDALRAGCSTQAQLPFDLQLRRFAIVSDEGGRMIQADTLRKVMRTHLDGLGLMNLHFYGCTALEIMTITGHQVEQMVKLYTNKSEQKKLATSSRQKA